MTSNACTIEPKYYAATAIIIVIRNIYRESTARCKLIEVYGAHCTVYHNVKSHSRGVIEMP